jgi:quercetin dioxygenase-like cupin family protein
MDTQLLRNRPAYTIDRETAPAMWLIGTLWLIQATGIQTNNRSTFLEQLMPHGLGPPTHRHPLAIEGFYVVEGVVDFHVDGKKVRAEGGTLIHLPRMVPHTFTVESEQTRVINFYAPAGAEMHVVSLARPAEERRRPTMEEGPPPKNPELNEILSRLYGSVGVTALPFAVQPAEELLVTKAGVWSAGNIKVARAGDGPVFDAFGLHWKLLAAGAETENNYDLLEVSAGDGMGMPARMLGADEVIYVLDGAVTVECDGQSIGGKIGSLTYMPAGSIVRWQANGKGRLLIFHFPGGFDRALAQGHGQDSLVAAWLESTGTRFITDMPLAPAVLNMPEGR